MNSLNRTTGLGAYNQWVCPFIYTLPHKAQFFVCLFVFYYIEFNSGWGAASSSRGGLQFEMLKIGLYIQYFRHTWKKRNHSQHWYRPPSYNRWNQYISLPVWTTVNPSELSLDVSVHLEQQLTLYKCFLYIPGNWYQNHHMPLIKGIWFCTQQFSPVTNGSCDCECGSGPIVLNGFGALYEIWKSWRYASMYRCWTMDLLF